LKIEQKLSGNLEKVEGIIVILLLFLSNIFIRHKLIDLFLLIQKKESKAVL